MPRSRYKNIQKSETVKTSLTKKEKEALVAFAKAKNISVAKAVRIIINKELGLPEVERIDRRIKRSGVPIDESDQERAQRLWGGTGTCAFCGEVNPPPKAKGTEKREYCSRKCRDEARLKRIGHISLEERKIIKIKNQHIKPGELRIETKKYGVITFLYDLEDAERIQKHIWYTGKHLYAATQVPIPDAGYYYYPDGRRQKRTRGLYLHSLIMNVPKGMVTDHISGNTLDNRKENLRVVTYAANSRNRGKSRNNTSGFKGVIRLRKTRDMTKELTRSWLARITHNKTPIDLGSYTTKEAAAKAYDRKACELWDIVNPERQLNFPELKEQYLAEIEAEKK